MALFTRAARRRVGLNPRRRRRRGYRRNPGFATGGGSIVRQIVQGAKDGLAVTLGSGFTNLGASKVPFAQTSAVGRGAVQVLVGLLGALIVRKVTKSERTASLYLAGAFSNVLRPVLANVPVIGPSLGTYYRGVGSYYRGPAGSPLLSGWGGAPEGVALIAGQQAGSGNAPEHGFNAGDEGYGDADSEYDEVATIA